MATPTLLDEPVLLKGGVTSAAYFGTPETMIPHNLVHGRLYRMATPIPLHQRIVGYMFRKMADAADGAGGEMILSPMDCEFAEGLIFQPDLLYIAPDRLHIIRDWVRGVPDIAIEVQSPSTRRFVERVKLPLYAEHGVREAWVVDPVARTVTVHTGDGTSWVSEETVAFGEDVPSAILQVGACGLA